MFLKNCIFLFIGAGLTACSFVLNKSVAVQNVPVSNESKTINAVDSLVSPYKAQLEDEMNRKVAFAEVDFINEQPSGNLGNMVADYMLTGPLPVGKEEAVCLLNFRGLRSTINQGEVLLGDVFKLLPFDNYLVLVKMPAGSAEEMKNWILRGGGHPISGFYIEKDVLYDRNKKPWPERDFWVVTSDYLLNGGDHATFFQSNLEVVHTGILLRDHFLNGIRGKSLSDNKEQRIILKQ